MRSRFSMRLPLLVFVLIAAVFAAAGCASKPTASEPSAAAKSASSAAEPTATASDEGSKTVPTAAVKTNKGTFTITFYPEKAPKTVASFIKLSQEGFYDGNKVHRYVPDFVVQMGDPQTNDMTAEDVVAGKNPRLGTGGPGFTLPAEFNDEKHVLGSVAMARSQDPNSAGSQFYIVVGPASFLDGQYTVFGKVTEGYDEVASKLRMGDEIESITITNGQ